MSELIVTVFRLGFLLFLWLFILFAIFSIRSDAYGFKMKFPSENQNTSDNKSNNKKDKNMATELFISSGQLSGTRVPLTLGYSIKIGRSPVSNIVIDDQYTSHEHSEIFNEGNQWFVQDIGSTNGTFLNDKRIDTSKIEKGDSIRIGETVLEVN
jgi:pSer/pThr/pTyr-binding forkhead associated (FHA) protein